MFNQIDRIEYVHSKKLLHRDIKPDNFLIGVGNKLIYLIDFGLSKFYYTKRTNGHIPYRDGKRFIGTVRYASINTSLGVEQGRRDDLESFIFCLIYFLKGELPWQGLTARTKREKENMILEKKIKTSVESLCEGLPKEIGEMLSYVRELKFEEEPDYSYLKKLIKGMKEANKIDSDGKFDWILKREKEKAEQLSKETEEKLKLEETKYCLVQTLLVTSFS